MSSTEDVLNTYRNAVAESDPQAVAAQHADDAVVISRGEIYRGSDEIEAHYEDLFAWMADTEATVTRDQQIIEDDVVHVVWSLEADDLTWEFAVDTFVIRDGKIAAHTVAVKAPDE